MDAVERRQVLRLILAAVAALLRTMGVGHGQSSAGGRARPAASERDAITLFVCGDVMTGRGIDQILPHPSPPQLRDPTSPRRSTMWRWPNGSMARSRDASTLLTCGDALSEFERKHPDVRIVKPRNRDYDKFSAQRHELSDEPRQHRLPHCRRYRLLRGTNNHVLDWGPRGLAETIATLDEAGIRHVGAGRNGIEAEAPAVLAVPDKGRVIVYAVGVESSGVSPAWAAGPRRPGINVLADLSPEAADHLAATALRHRQHGDVVAFRSTGDTIGVQHPTAAPGICAPPDRRRCRRHRYGHSSHHPLAVEVHKGKPILYGCGDFLNDYDGIEGYEAFRDDLVLMYFLTVHSGSGELERLELTSLRIKNFKLNRPAAEEADWLGATLDRECRQFGAAVEQTTDGSLRLLWT